MNLRQQKQTRFGGTSGNCFAACVASIFQMWLHEIPNFCEVGDEWWAPFEMWCRRLGFQPICLPTPDGCDWALWFAPGQLVIASGLGARGFAHSVLYMDGKLFFDPHPDDSGIASVKDVIAFLRIDPSDCFEKRLED